MQDSLDLASILNGHHQNVKRAQEQLAAGGRGYIPQATGMRMMKRRCRLRIITRLSDGLANVKLPSTSQEVDLSGLAMVTRAGNKPYELKSLTFAKPELATRNEVVQQPKASFERLGDLAKIAFKTPTTQHDVRAIRAEWSPSTYRDQFLEKTIADTFTARPETYHLIEKGTKILEISTDADG